MKRIITICAVLLLCTFCFAADIEDVIAKAYQSSPQVGQYERSRQDSLLNGNTSDRFFSYTVNVTQPVPLDGGTYHLPGADATLTLNDKVSNIALNGTLRYSPDKQTDNSYIHVLSGTFTISKTFDFSGWSSYDYTRKIRDVSVELNYGTSVLNLRKNVLKDVYSIIEAQHNIAKSQRQLEESQREYNSKIATGELKEGSTAQIKAKMALDSAVSSLDSQKKSLESKLTAFEKNYGFAYTDVDSASRPDLVFEPNPESNSSVYIAKLNLLSSEQDLNEKTGKAKKVELSTKINPFSFRMGTSLDNNSDFTINPGVAFINGNFSVSANMSSTYSNSEWSKPTMTIKGSYSGGNSNSADIAKQENDVYSKQLAYDTAVFNYNTSTKTVEDNIQKALVGYDQLEIRKDYNNRILEYTQTLYENGFTTAKALEDARFEVESDMIDELLLNLAALQLECEIKILAL